MAEPATATRPAPLPPAEPPRLDHAFLVLDDRAYRDVARSSFLRDQFARVTCKQSSSSLAGEYSAIAVAGENTLIELFPTEPLPGVTAGLVLSYEVVGSLHAAAEVLGRPVELVHRVVDGEPRPWYHLVQPHLGADSPFRLMLAEVSPAYFAGIGAEAHGRSASARAEVHSGRQTRRAYLSAMLGRPAAPGLGLRDVTVVTVRLRPERARALAVTLAALGYSVADTTGGTVLRGPDERIRITVDETGPEGVVALGLALNHPNPVRRVFGESSRLDGDVWTFHPCGRQT